jgi:hypothetical protein
VQAWPFLLLSSKYKPIVMLTAPNAGPEYCWKETNSESLITSLNAPIAAPIRAYAAMRPRLKIRVTKMPLRNPAFIPAM